MFETNDKVFILNKHPNESNTFYYTKFNFIKNCNLTQYSFEYLLKMANIYTNNKLYGCEYNEHIIEELNKISS